MRKIVFSSVFIALFLVSSVLFPYPDIKQNSHAVSVPLKQTSITPNSRFIFSYSNSSSTISVFDALIFEEVATYSVGHAVNDMAVSSDGMTAYLVTSENDKIVILDISDPENIEETGTYTLGSAGVAFTDIALAEVSGKRYLYATDATNDKIQIYNVTGASNSSIDLSYTPVDVAVSPDNLTFGVLASDGTFYVYGAESYSAVSSIDASVCTSAANFTKLSLGSVPSLGEVAFLLNPNAAGEICLVGLTDKYGSLYMIDADPTAGDADDPIIIGSGLSDMILATVNDPDSGDSTGYYIYSFATAGGRIIDTKGMGSEKLEPFSTLSGLGTVLRNGIAAGTASDGYVYYGDSAGQAIGAVSENPVITMVSPTGSVNITSGDIDIKFKSDTAGSYRVNRVTGTPQDSMSSAVGTALASGTLAVDQEITVNVATDDLEEGENIIAIFVTSGDLVGREGLIIDYDTIPGVPNNLKVEFGDQKLFISFGRNTESDMDHYNLYFGTASDSLTGADGIASPVSIDHPESGSKVTYTLSPLTNGVEIFLQVSAVDETGNESERTDMVSNIPEETIGIIDLSGETGGCGVVGAGSGIFFLILTVIVLCIFFRARKVFLAFLAVFLLSAPAFSQETESETGENHVPITLDTPAPESDPQEISYPLDGGQSKKLKDFMSTAFKVSWFMPKNTYLKDFYGVNGNELYGLKSSFFVWFFEIGFEAGVLWEKGRMVGTTTGRPSGEKVKLLMLPFSFPLYINARFTDRQVLVPYGKIGYNLLHFRIYEPTQQVDGIRNMLITGAGLKFNFENISYSVAGIQDFGINHMFLFFEWNYCHDFHSGTGISFSGHTWGFGVGVDY